MPSHWVPLYSSVSFTCMPYKKCIENRAWQDRFLSRLIAIGGIGSAALMTVGAYQLFKVYGDIIYEKINF